MKRIIGTVVTDVAVVDAVIEGLVALGVANINDIDVLTDKDLAGAFAGAKLTLVQSRALIKKLREAVVSENTYQPDFTTLPEHLQSKIDIKVTANIIPDVDSIVKWINILSLNNLGIEDIATALQARVTARFGELKVGATQEQLEIFRTVNKFTSINDSLYDTLMSKINMAQGLVDARHTIIENGNNVFLPDLVRFVNDSLDLGVNTAAIDLAVIRRVLSVPKVGQKVNVEDFIMAANGFIANVNTQLAGLNSLIISSTYELYHELYDLLESKELQEFLGVKNKEELLRSMGVEITPKQARTYGELPKYVFALLSAIEKPELLSNPNNMYVYLQTAWEAFRTLDLEGIAPTVARDRAYNVSVSING